MILIFLPTQQAASILHYLDSLTIGHLAKIFSGATDREQLLVHSRYQIFKISTKHIPSTTT